MRYTSVMVAIVAVASLMISLHAEAQPRQRRVGQGGPVEVRVTPRSFLDPGTVVPAGSINPGISGHGQMQFYLLSPSHAPSGDGFSPFGPVNFVAPPGLVR